MYCVVVAGRIVNAVPTRAITPPCHIDRSHVLNVAIWKPRDKSRDLRSSLLR